MQENRIECKTDRDHILLRNGMYIGGKKHTYKSAFILENDKFKYNSFSVVNGLLKIINEIIDNSVDEAIRTNCQHANKIGVCVKDNGEISVSDNGRGIPVEKVILPDKSQEWGPVLAWTHARAGANFNDEERKGIGMNGVGSFATNCFSTKFVAETCDGKKKLVLKCKDNADPKKISTKVETCKDNTGTIVSFVPDYEKFGVEGIDDLHMTMIEQRLIHLAMCFPKIQFKFNGRVVKIRSTKQYLDAFSDSYEYLETDKYIIAVMPNDSDDFRFSAAVNGLDTYKGGNHIDHICGEVCYKLRDRISKKYKQIKPGDIKNKIQLVVVFRDFPEFDTSGQTKEEMVNSRQEIMNFLGYVDWDKLVMKIHKNTDILDPIVETYKLKEELKARMEAKSKNKKLLKNFKCEKYWEPHGSKEYLFLCEGDSAKGGLMDVLGRKDYGFFAGRGVPLNAYDSTVNRILSNKEYEAIIGILSIELGSVKRLSYKTIVLAQDADADGAHIAGLYIGFFNKYCPEVLKEGRLKRLKTPVIALKKKDKIVEYFFDLESYKEFEKKKGIKGYEVKYFKGLGSWNSDELRDLIMNNGGLNAFLETLSVDVHSNEAINDWLSGKKSDVRKEYIRESPFDIFNL